MQRAAYQGSSPPARGAPAETSTDRGTGGIIPACAGSTAWRPPTTAPPGDHPRLRGEHLGIKNPMVVFDGSSPPARGAPAMGAGLAMLVGIIPACAGSTLGASSIRASARDHPRLRGEHLSNIGDLGPESGSSPPARGARGRIGVDHELPGIIPACAGSTGCGCVRPRWRWDHPRLRGEHIRPLVMSSSVGGSSPPARGAQVPVPGAAPAPGIIPACAGSTSCGMLVARPIRDHPRLRGEHRAGQTHR